MHPLKGNGSMGMMVSNLFLSYDRMNEKEEQEEEEDDENQRIKPLFLGVYIGKSAINNHCLDSLCVTYIFYRIGSKNDHVSFLSRFYRTYSVANI